MRYEQTNDAGNYSYPSILAGRAGRIRDLVVFQILKMVSGLIERMDSSEMCL